MNTMNSLLFARSLAKRKFTIQRKSFASGMTSHNVAAVCQPSLNGFCRLSGNRRAGLGKRFVPRKVRGAKRPGDYRRNDLSNWLSNLVS